VIRKPGGERTSFPVTSNAICPKSSSGYKIDCPISAIPSMFIVIIRAAICLSKSSVIYCYGAFKTSFRRFHAYGQEPGGEPASRLKQSALRRKLNTG
jgi:hypothetical protein